jgi:hypothetical protein
MTAMRRLAQGLAENTGASLGAAGVLVAAALGLTQAGGGWLVVGIVLAVIALIWAGVTLGAAMIQSARTNAFRQALARAQRDGEAILRSKPDSARAEAWGQVHDLIAAGLGDAEAELFPSNHDLGIGLRSPNDTDADVWMRRRLQRLSRLLDRIHSMSARIDFDSKQWRL